MPPQRAPAASDSGTPSPRSATAAHDQPFLPRGRGQHPSALTITITVSVVSVGPRTTIRGGQVATHGRRRLPAFSRLPRGNRWNPGSSLTHEAWSPELVPLRHRLTLSSDHIAPRRGRRPGRGPTAVHRCLSGIPMTATAAILLHSGVTGPTSIHLPRQSFRFGTRLVLGHAQ